MPVTDAERSSAGIAAEVPPESSSRPSGAPDSWLRRHLNPVAWSIVAAGFAVRFRIAGLTYLNPDEALHYQLIHQKSLWLAYQASLTNAHPPLIFVILYFWHFLGRSELVLRLPSVILGTLCCWAGFRWVSQLFGKTAGLIALVLFAFSPATLALSAEVRGYALLLLCITTSLYFLTRSLQEESARLMWGFSIFLYLAILSHYSAMFFTVGAGVYVVARILDKEVPRKVVNAWLAGQIGAFLLYVFLYVTHVSKLKNSITAWGMPFEAAYYHSYAETLWGFTSINTRNIFLFLFGETHVAHTLLLAFAGAVIYLFGREMRNARTDARTRRAGILLAFPLIAVWAASMVAIYPYVGRRHTMFVAPLIIAGASFALAAICRQNMLAALLLAGILVAGSALAAKPVEPGVSDDDQRPATMAAAISYLRQNVPAGEPIFLDMQSSLPITFYFCGDEIAPPVETFDRAYFEFTCAGHPVIALHFWKVMAATFSSHFEKMARNHGLRPGDRVWVFQTGWGLSLKNDLPTYDSRFRCLDAKSFGSGISIMPMLVGDDYLPVTPSQSCAR
jgi:uncharacterized membrane protein